MGSKSCLSGMEVPIIGSDAIKWFQVSVPSSILPSSSAASLTASNTLTKDLGSCFVIGNPPTYVFWKIGKNQPNVVEIVALEGAGEFPKYGLQIWFPEALFPFVLICKDETQVGAVYPYMLYAVTVSGVAYLIRLRSIYDYASCSCFSPNEVLEYNMQHNAAHADITAVAASPGCVAVGRIDGSASCIQLGLLEPSSSGFVFELRDDVGLGRLWGIMSRTRMVSTIHYLVMLELFQKKLLFVIHSDGIFRLWDLASRSKIFSHSTGSTSIKLWVGEPNYERSVIPLAMLHEDSSGVDTKMVCIYGLKYGIGDKIMFTMESSILSIPMKNDELIDVKLTSDSVWILKDEGVVMQELFGTEGVAHCYSLQEAFVSDQLFQSSENSSDDILWLAHTVFPYPKEQIASVVSSIFMRRLLLPGIYHNSVLRATLQEYNKHFTDSEFNSFTADGVKTEVLAVIEHEGVSGSPVQMLNTWKAFCTRYYYNWCKINASCGLFIDSFSGAVGLVRKNNFSLFRVLDGIELLIYGSFDEFDSSTTGSWMDFSNDELERGIVFEVLQCISNVSQQLGKAASAVFYESMRTQLSSEEVLSRFLKILEAGHGSSITALHVSELGTDIAWEKEALSHRNLRKFSMDLFLSLHSLYSRATSWNKVLDVIEKYLNFLVPKMIEQKLDFSTRFTLTAPITVQATSQVAKVMFESAIDVFMLLNYMVNRSGQIRMSHEDVSRIKLELVPMISEILSEWHVIHFFVTSPTESHAMDDFSIQLSALQIDGNTGKRTFNEKLGKCDFTLAFVLVLTLQSASGDQSHTSSMQLTDPSSILNLVREFTSWVIWGRTGEESSIFTHSINLALIFLQHGQYDAIEYLLTFVDAYLQKEKIFESVQSEDGRWATLLHLLGCCLVAHAHRGLHGVIREKKISEAICCFYRAASIKGAPDALKDFPPEAGWARVDFTSYSSASSWKLHYYQWAMQIFEQYNMNEAACRFALTALEQVDEALALKDSTCGPDSIDESATVIKGRLWANIFKFSLDLSSYSDAYCAIISNPDEESKNTCLRRFIFVLCERGAVKILCDGQLPFVGLGEKVEQELAWKAGRSDILVKPNAFKLLYAFEMHRHNWRKAASYIYQYSSHLKIEVEMKDHQHRAFALQERLNGISAAINALQLVHPTCAWIDTTNESTTIKEPYPSKRARITKEPSPNDVDALKKLHSRVDIEKLENDYVLTSAEYFLSLASIKWTYTGFDKPSSNLVDLLVESNLYDVAFTVVLRFWKHSGLKRELERIFTAMALKCCPSGLASSLRDNRMQTFLLTSSQNNGGLLDPGPLAQQFVGNSQWETLEIYLEKYSGYHRRLPVVVAETLLAADSQIELPLWLVQIFKGVRQENSFGMSGVESNPASLFRLYVDYGRYIEATNLLLESIESLSAMVPTDVIRRKKPFAIWFPYNIIERLWCQLQESIRFGHMVEQCEKLKTLLQGALRKHLNMVKVDSDDVLSSGMH